MTELSVGLATIMLTSSILLYLALIAFQGVLLVVDGWSVGRVSTGTVGALSQNIGVTCALLGLLVSTQALSIVGVLLVAAGLCLGDNEERLPRPIEVTLIICGLLSVGSLAVFRVVI